jgi:hypothetical protein
MSWLNSHDDAVPRSGQLELLEAGVAAEVARAARARFVEEIRRGVEQHERWIAEFGLLSEQVAALQDEAGDAA